MFVSQLPVDLQGERKKFSTRDTEAHNVDAGCSRTGIRCTLIVFCSIQSGREFWLVDAAATHS
ncbi:hypothetical protein Jden_0191 [Jonesia denitrificans DSM 20603]|uniref:Uncharacterized protein n=1 Tax=Jonesia denitrificans (strain ATCC 14870 / DSM 20603 / BCRC 15368 / CIP 55.134 / JCM 11481 / NBRC 15587 / NCTC 10816 / Prevot 55134) TaxID=471856 RepID=C7QYL8_JONDD|nr:hypothetical protein Jden_0191 [Jonesia denitrificans DSM 20603]